MKKRYSFIELKWALPHIQEDFIWIHKKIELENVEKLYKMYRFFGILSHITSKKLYLNTEIFNEII